MKRFISFFVFFVMLLFFGRQQRYFIESVEENADTSIEIVIEKPTQTQNTHKEDDNKKTDETFTIDTQASEELPIYVKVDHVQTLSYKEYFSLERDLSYVTNEPFQGIYYGTKLEYLFDDDSTKLIMQDLERSTKTVIFEAEEGSRISAQGMFLTSSILIFIVDDTIYRVYLPTGTVDIWVKDNEIRDLVNNYVEDIPLTIMHYLPRFDYFTEIIDHIVVASNTDIVWKIPQKYEDENDGYGYYRAYSRITGRKYLLDGKLLSYSFSRYEILTRGYLARRAKDMEYIGYNPNKVAALTYRTSREDSSDIVMNMDAWYAFINNYDTTVPDVLYTPYNSSWCINDFVIYSSDGAVVKQAIPVYESGRLTINSQVSLNNFEECVTWRGIRIGDDMYTALRQMDIPKEAVIVLDCTDGWGRYYIPLNLEQLSDLINLDTYVKETSSGEDRFIGTSSVFFVQIFLDKDYNPVNVLTLQEDAPNREYEHTLYLSNGEPLPSYIFSKRGEPQVVMQITIVVNKWGDSDFQLTNELIIHNYSATFSDIEFAYSLAHQPK